MKQKDMVELLSDKDRRIKELEVENKDLKEENANMTLAIDTTKRALSLGTTFRERIAFKYLNHIKDNPYYAKLINIISDKDKQITTLTAEVESLNASLELQSR